MHPNYSNPIVIVISQPSSNLTQDIHSIGSTHYLLNNWLSYQMQADLLILFGSTVPKIENMILNNIATIAPINIHSIS